MRTEETNQIGKRQGGNEIVARQGFTLTSVLKGHLGDAVLADLNAVDAGLRENRPPLLHDGSTNALEELAHALLGIVIAFGVGPRRLLANAEQTPKGIAQTQEGNALRRPVGGELLWWDAP